MISSYRLKELFKYNGDTGVFTRKKSKSNRTGLHYPVGTKTTYGYLSTIIDGKSYLLHRLAWMYVYGGMPSMQIDHINGIRTDNRICNLRDVDHSTNQKNTKTPKNNTSGVVGVYWKSDKNLWFGEVRLNGKTKNLGYFKYKWDAICARKSAERLYGYHENHGRK